MTNHQDRQKGARIEVGNIKNSNNISIGNVTSVAVTHQQLSVQAQAAELMDEIIHQLAVHRESLDDPAGVLQSAQAARSELAVPSPRWQIVRGLLRGVTAGVAGVSALTDAIDKVQALIAHLAT